MPRYTRTRTKKAIKKWGKKGGKARLRTMTEQERRESAIKAATARWSKKQEPQAKQSIPA